MNRETLLILILLSVGILCTNSNSEAADSVFPGDWAKWTSVSTTLTKIGALPDCNADVHTLPPIYQETISTFCNVRTGGPGKVAVLINPASVTAYQTRKGKFADGNNLILHLIDMKVLFVTSHKNGEPSYAVFTEDGKNISAPSGPLSPTTCSACHSGYTAFCVAGQCGKITK